MITMAEQRPGFGPPAPVPIHQYESEFAQLLDLYRERKPRQVLEIGTFHGGTLYHWLQNAEKGAWIVTVDSYATGVDNRSLYDEWIPADVGLLVVDGNSHDPNTVKAIDALSPFEWVFIDAGHHYDEVKADWEIYGPMCKGVTCFHDILHPPVARLWSEIKAERDPYDYHEIIADPDSEWCGIGCVFS